jgi:hypothetical protein
MVADNSLHGAKTETAAGEFGTEERIEDLGLDLRASSRNRYRSPSTGRSHSRRDLLRRQTAPRQIERLTGSPR